MNKSYNQFINRRVFVIITCMITLLTSVACKRADKEVTMDLLESKLVTEDPYAWLSVLTLSIDDSADPVHVIMFYDDNTFKYKHGIYSIDGTWSFNYAANRSGQFLTLNMAYTYLTDSYFESFELKYSSEQDMFYNVDHNNQSLYPWETTIYIP